MGSAGIDDSSQKAIEPELIEVGTKLLRHPSSTDELLMLLDVCGFIFHLLGAICSEALIIFI